MKTSLKKINFYATALMFAFVSVFTYLVVIAIQNNNL